MDKLIVNTPMGNLVAYPSNDPSNPGIHVELKRHGIDYMLNLATVECQIPNDIEDCVMKTHVWGDASQEDPTDQIEHRDINDYFEGGAA